MSVRTAFLVFAVGVLAFRSAIKPVAAATATASFSVSATVQASCIATVAPTAIRTYAAEALAASAASVTCSNSVPYNVSLNAEAVSGAAIAIRPLARSGFASLSYALGPNLRGVAHGRQAVNHDQATGPGSSFTPGLPSPARLSAQCASSGRTSDTIVIVVTY